MTTLGCFKERDLVSPGEYWQLSVGVNGYAHPIGNELVTQAAAGRGFKVVDCFSRSVDIAASSRFRACLLEDGYCCWLNLSDVIGSAFHLGSWQPCLLNRDAIEKRLPDVLHWVQRAAGQKNKYLWGGAIGPDFDCSGLVQAGFASQHIWLPRDAYQQERFCDGLVVSPENFQSLIPGDLLFFGSKKCCTHVGIYRGDGCYWHSSGSQDGNNGIGSDCLSGKDLHPVPTHYRSILRGAGRVVQCHDGATLP